MTGPALRISRTHFPVTALGPGVRLGIWVQGCPLACKGCMALDTWSPDGGGEVDVAALADLWRGAIDAGAVGLTVSGGEPLAQPGPLSTFLAEAHRIRGDAQERTGGDYDILMYTGFELSELSAEQERAAAYADVLVTGRFQVAQPTDLVWRGSANQRMVIRTELGRRRYPPYLHERPANPPIQVQVDGSGAWIVGVPRRGTLASLDRTLRRSGLDVHRASWRPPAAPG